MTDTNSLRTGAGYALEVGLYATHMAMTEAADTIDALRAENERLRACFDWANGAAEEGWLPAQEVRKLRAQLVEAQRDALGSHDVREPTAIGRAVNRAARDLPEGWEIRIDLERGSGAVHLTDPEGKETMIDGSGELFSDQINAAIDAAKGEQ